MAQISIGVESIDKAIGGGINPQTITLIYGEPETGKSTLAMQAAVHCALQGQKILYADCDNNFSTQRLAQLSGDRFDDVAERIILVKPQDFKEQTALIDHIEDYTTGVGLIVIDTFTSLYSAKAAEFSRAYGTNRELNRQLAILAQTVKTKKIPLVMTSQVRSVIGNDASDVRPVATRVLQFWAENILFLKPTQIPQTIKVTIEKTTGSLHSNICYVQIGGNGIKDTQLH